MTKNIASQGWNSGKFGLRCPVNFESVSAKKFYLYRSTRRLSALLSILGQVVNTTDKQGRRVCQDEVGLQADIMDQVSGKSLDTFSTLNPEGRRNVPGNFLDWWETLYQVHSIHLKYLLGVGLQVDDATCNLYLVYWNLCLVVLFRTPKGMF